jgi:hypothetical protein
LSLPIRLFLTDDYDGVGFAQDNFPRSSIRFSVHPANAAFRIYINSILGKSDKLRRNPTEQNAVRKGHPGIPWGHVVAIKEAFSRMLKNCAESPISRLV